MPLMKPADVMMLQDRNLSSNACKQRRRRVKRRRQKPKKLPESVNHNSNWSPSDPRNSSTGRAKPVTSANKALLQNMHRKAMPMAGNRECTLDTWLNGLFPDVLLLAALSSTSPIPRRRSTETWRAHNLLSVPMPLLSADCLGMHFGAQATP